MGKAIALQQAVALGVPGCKPGNIVEALIYFKQLLIFLS